MKGMAAVLKRALAESYRQLENIPLPELLAARRENGLITVNSGIRRNPNKG